MMIVIDANAVVSALLKDGKSRQIIVSGKFTPDFQFRISQISV